jgi:hypothetical protein
MNLRAGEGLMKRGAKELQCMNKGCIRDRSLVSTACQLAITFAVGILLISAADSAWASSAEVYVYAADVKGNVYYRQTSGKNIHPEKVRSMQILNPGTILEITKGSSVTLTCPQCKTQTFTTVDSPYTISMKDFIKSDSKLGAAAEHFAAALKNFVYPESKQGRIIYPRVRGPEESSATTPKSILMQPAGIIIPVGERITFIWTPTDVNFSIRISESRSKMAIYSQEKIAANYINIDAVKFVAGRRYTWYLNEEGGGRIYEENFTLLSAGDRNRIMNTLNDIGSILPVVVSQENRYRLQAGYLNSEHFTYDAWQWLDIHGISDQ